MTALRVTNYPRARHSSPSLIIQKIIDRVHAKGYTYLSLAEKMDCDESHLRKVLQGRVKPSVEYSEKLAKAVGLRITVE